MAKNEFCAANAKKYDRMTGKTRIRLSEGVPGRTTVSSLLDHCGPFDVTAPLVAWTTSLDHEERTKLSGSELEMRDRVQTEPSDDVRVSEIRSRLVWSGAIRRAAATVSSKNAGEEERPM